VIIPWATCIALSLLAGRTIVVARYLLFCHVFFVGVCAWALECAAWRRVAMAAGLLVAIGFGITVQDYLRSACGAIPPVEQAAHYVKRDLEDEDAVLCARPALLNAFLYYAKRSDLHPRRTWCLSTKASRGHAVHVAAIANDNLLPCAISDLHTLNRRIWVILEPGDRLPAPARMGASREETFGGSGPPCGVIRYEPLQKEPTH
jgi:hypothetical protein